MTYATILILLGLAALLAYIRLAPSDPQVWHVPVADLSTPATPGPCLDHLVTYRNGARVTCLLPDAPEAVLSRLDSNRPPRTTLLAGIPASGLMTWVTRSRLIGYPDYTTAEATVTPEGTRLDIYARQRFGSGDWGVNAARLTDWLTHL